MTGAGSTVGTNGGAAEGGTVGAATGGETVAAAGARSMGTICAVAGAAMASRRTEEYFIAAEYCVPRLDGT